MEKLDEVIFYTLEKSIKTYRQFAQREIGKSGVDITIDQWLILKTIQEFPEFTQNQIAEMVFKDFASVTRIIELLVKKEYIFRQFHSDDRRRFELSLTDAGNEVLEKIYPIIKENRNRALNGFSTDEIEKLSEYLTKLTNNCN